MYTGVRSCSASGLMPGLEVGRLFEARFQIAVQVDVEVDARHLLNLIHGVGGLLHSLAGRRVAVVEANGLFVALAQREYDLEEAVGHADGVVAPDGAVLLARLEHGAAHDVDAALGLGPSAAGFFERGPAAAVELRVLRADVAHVEALAHGLLAPFHVGRGALVAAVVAAARVVGGGHLLRLRQQGVGLEVVGARGGTFGFIRRQFPGHPVGLHVVAVERERKARVADDALVYAVTDAGGLLNEAPVAGRL